MPGEHSKSDNALLSQAKDKIAGDVDPAKLAMAMVVIAVICFNDIKGMVIQSRGAELVHGTNMFKGIPATEGEFQDILEDTASTPEGGLASFMLAVLTYAYHPEVGEAALVHAIHESQLKSVGDEQEEAFELKKTDAAHFSAQFQQQPMRFNPPCSFFTGCYGQELPGNEISVNISRTGLHSKEKCGDDLCKLYIQSVATQDFKPVTMAKSDGPMGLWKVQDWQAVYKDAPRAARRNVEEDWQYMPVLHSVFARTRSQFTVAFVGVAICAFYLKIADQSLPESMGMPTLVAKFIPMIPGFCFFYYCKSNRLYPVFGTQIHIIGSLVILYALDWLLKMLYKVLVSGRSSGAKPPNKKKDK
eukprot:gene9252-1662_t